MNWQKKSWKRDMWIKFQAGVLSAETCLIETPPPLINTKKTIINPDKVNNLSA